MKGERITIQEREQVNVLVHKEKDSGVKIKLAFLSIMANSDIAFEKACEIFGIAVSTGYLWIRQWNEKEYRGIQRKGKRTGRPPYILKEDLKKLKEMLKEKTSWTAKEVRELIKERFAIDYSDDQVLRILRDKLKLRFSKLHGINDRMRRNNDGGKKATRAYLFTA